MGDRRSLCSEIQSKAHKFASSPTVKQPFRVVTITLLSLLLPLSFLLLARLSCARFIQTLADINNNNPSKHPHFFSIFLYTNPALLFFLVSAISVSTLVHNLTGNAKDRPSNLHRPMRRYASWIILCTLQVCVGLGIGGSVAFGTDYSGFAGARNRSLLSRTAFFVGLHETMFHWCRVVVRPVVDDAVFGAGSRVFGAISEVSGAVSGVSGAFSDVFGGGSGAVEKWAVRGAMSGGFGSLWYWRLRGEVESLVVVAEVKGEMLMKVGFGDFVGWWLYYLTVTLGLVRVVKGIMWVVVSLFRRRFNRDGMVYGNHNDDHDDGDDHDDDEEKFMVSRNVHAC